MKTISLNLIERGPYNEDTAAYEEASRAVEVNPALIRCFYARREDRPGSRVTFNDGGGFAVSERPDQISGLIADLTVSN